jgi:predicted translin family RNA/ssDNA-binding protein
MDGLSGAASVIAVIDLSAKITALCFQYSIAVKDAKNDIERIKKEVDDIERILKSIKRLLDTKHDSLLLMAYSNHSSNACGSCRSWRKS